MTDRTVANAPRALPQPLDHALAQLRRRRVLLVPGELGTAPEGGKRYPIALTRSLLGRLPGSPALRAALGTAPGRAVFQVNGRQGDGRAPAHLGRDPRDIEPALRRDGQRPAERVKHFETLARCIYCRASTVSVVGPGALIQTTAGRAGGVGG